MRCMKTCVALAAGFIMAEAADALAQSPEAFYRGKTVELYVGTDPGGGYDLYGRLVARYIGKHIPGAPALIVKNMPGAGHLRMANWVYSAAPRDGSVIAMAPQSIAIEQLLETAGVQYDARRFSWIGRVAPVVEVTYTWHTSQTKTLDDAKRRDTVMGGSGAASPTVFYLKALNQLAGTKFNVISAYPSNAETNLAMQRGEVEGGSKAWASMKVDNADWLREKKVNILVQYATSRDADLPDVPLMMELGRTEEERRALNLFAMGNAMGRSVMATPEIQLDRLTALQTAFENTMKDAELIGFTQERKIDVGPILTGKELQALVMETMATPPDVVKLTKAARGD